MIKELFPIVLALKIMGNILEIKKILFMSDNEAVLSYVKDDNENYIAFFLLKSIT